MDVIRKRMVLEVKNKDVGFSENPTSQTVDKLGVELITQHHFVITKQKNSFF